MVSRAQTLRAIAPGSLSLEAMMSWAQTLVVGRIELCPANWPDVIFGIWTNRMTRSERLSSIFKPRCFPITPDRTGGGGWGREGHRRAVPHSGGLLPMP